MAAKTKEVDVEKLLGENPNQVLAPVLKRALEEKKRRDEKEQEEQAIALLGEIEYEVQERVTVVRDIRRREKRAIAQLKAYVAAREVFLKNGNVDEYKQVLREKLNEAIRLHPV